MKILITGASSGIGKACALRFAKAEHHLVLFARRKEKLLQLREEILKQSPQTQVDTVVLDVRDRDSVQELASHTSHFENVDLLINNAGLALGNSPLHLAEIEDWEAMIDTNIKGLLYITRSVLPDMVQRKSGHLVNIGSVAGRWVYPGGNVYNATKFAVRALSEGIRQDILGSHVRVTNIEPGMVETEFSKVRFQNEEKAKKVYEGMTPLSAEDIAETVEWCVLRPPHVNIQELVIFPTDQASVTQVHRS